MILSVVSACTPYEPPVVMGGIKHEIVGAELRLSDNILNVKNTYNEETTRLLLDITYYRDGVVIGSDGRVGRTLREGESHNYFLSIPEGTDTVKVAYSEYKNKFSGLIIGTPIVSKRGAVIFNITD